MQYVQNLRNILIKLVLIIALLLNSKIASAGYWVCTYSPIGPNNKKYMSYSSENIALMYLGYTNYYDGKIVKVHMRDQYDYLTASMFMSIGLNYTVFNSNKNNYKTNYKLNGINSRLTPEMVKDDIDMVIMMRSNSPSIGYVNELLPIYDVSLCLTPN